MLRALVRKIKNIFSKKDLPETAKIGQMGEALATDFLRKKGFSILERNWRYRKSEIDIICKQDSVLVFVEVKTRSKKSKVGGYFSAVEKHKKAMVKAGAKAYMTKMRVKPKTYRFDVVVVEHSNEGNEIFHYENVY